jgi:uncharacterized membrane protein
MMLLLLSAVPAIAGTARLVQLAGGAPVTPDNARFFAMPLPVIIHIVSVIPFSILGAFQLVPKLRRKGSRWHRLAGRLLAPLGMAAALSGLWMTQFYPWPAPDGIWVYELRMVFGSAMLVSLALGIEAIRRRDFASHGDWMLRAYAVGMGAGTQVLTHLPWMILGAKPGETGRAIAMGSAWIVNLLIAESIIARRSGSFRALTSRVA